MNEAHSLIAFLAVLAAIVALVALAVYASLMGAKLEALGVGAAVTGLIGVLGTFRPKTPQASVP